MMVFGKSVQLGHYPYTEGNKQRKSDPKRNSRSLNQNTLNQNLFSALLMARPCSRTAMPGLFAASTPLRAWLLLRTTRLSFAFASHDTLRVMFLGKILSVSEYSNDRGGFIDRCSSFQAFQKLIEWRGAHQVASWLCQISHDLFIPYHLAAHVALESPFGAAPATVEQLGLGA